ncbi:CoA-transferase family III [Gloeophyllum trabeum ATCC 11539]|uniref:CoA-transferase family III n=1 Tax=Gloeophyllum trabeum (strain ATCC 11539 / FP-39264 / Madison 617) TaxID=670483 RepID=S7RR43_GLOTA|nr:CoA-transferase family III [Gloeophyllum trabeum ATCC 11539]EPQ55389.1 CoA-transferase family III [Gloeophyllum trabeum ATCC 11539]
MFSDPLTPIVSATSRLSPTIIPLPPAALTETPSYLPLSGVRVLELGQLIAGPFAGQLLAHYGAEVIKVEPPKTGDPLRVWRELDIDGTSPWWRCIGRNKKSVTIDMRKAGGRDLVRKLALKCDVILENFKPGTLEKWGLGPDALHPHNPSLIFTRVSGYGQTGPWASRPGYASVCEAESGFRYINGFPDRDGGLEGPPVRPNMSLGDSVAGLHAAFGTVLALLQRGKCGGNGQTVDVSIMESMLNLMEGIIPEYDRKGKIRGPSGSSLTGIVPTNAYPCLPSSSSPSSPTYIIIGANGDSIYNRLMQAMGRPDLTGPKYQHNQHRVERQAEIEQAIVEWTSKRSVEEVERVLREAGVPTGRVNSVKEVVENEQVKDRGFVEDGVVSAPNPGSGWYVKMPKVVPLLEGSDPQTRWAGPDLGEHNEEVLVRELGLTAKELRTLRDDGVVGSEFP